MKVTSRWRTCVDSSAHGLNCACAQRLWSIVLTCSDNNTTLVHRDTTETSQVHRDTTETSQVHRDTTETLQVHRDTTETSQVHRDTTETSQVHRDITETSQVHRDITETSQVHRDMGFLLSKSMDTSFQKQQEFMLHNARLQMERQILMQNQMRERQMAMQIAWSREFLKYFGTFFGLASLGLSVGAIKKRRAGLLGPLVPLGFIFAYQLDMAYGTFVYRMKEEAENIMAAEGTRLELPHGVPTFESIEKARRAKNTLTAFLEK